MAAANLTDVQAVEKLVALIPNNQQLKDALKPGFAGDVDIYHAATRTARYVRADGQLAVCFILTEVSQAEALAVGEAFDKVKIKDMGYPSFEAAVRSVIRADIEKVN